MKTLIIGAGGYISSTVLPALNDLPDLHLGSKNHVNAINLANEYSLKFFDLNKIKKEKFDLYFLALPTFEVCHFLQFLPDFSKVWLEKPLAALDSDSLDELDKLVKAKNLDVHCGLLKRSIVSTLNEPIKSIRYTCNVPIQNNWKKIVSGGANWVDGIHAIDLYYLANNHSFKDTNINIIDNKLCVKHIEKPLEVNVGASGYDELYLNTKNITKMLEYEKSQKFLRKQFIKFTCNNGNYDSVHKMQSESKQLENIVNLVNLKIG